MKNDMVKLEDLEVDTIYKDNSGHFFKLFYDKYSESPRLYDNVATILTWERNYNSPDENDDTLNEFAKKHGVDIFHEWNMDSVMDAMRKEGYCVVPVYALHHGVSHYSSYDFHDPWDFGVVGIAFCKKQKGRYDNDDLLRRIIEDEIKEYDAWVNGEVYGIMLLDKNEGVLDQTTNWVMLDEEKTDTLENMLLSVEVDIQDEYQKAVRETSVTLK